ncbi:MAG: PadR family transcriptional regulator [Lentisphaerae bacterium]|nr:PadR family transcriptional regulator [Lentisphaerota bacterium]
MDDPAYLDNWTVQIRRGWIELCVLKALERGERYGYDLVRMLAGLPGLDVTEGTLYPLLSRLRLQGLVSTRLVESAEGPARKYYALTARGRRTLAQMNDHVETLVRQVRRLGETEDRR